MMTIKLIYFGLYLSLSFFVHQTDAQTFICNSIEGYNTLDLTSATQWQVSPDYQCLDNPAADCTFYISFCQPAPMCFNEYSACEKTSVKPNVTIIGAYTPTVFYENESGPKGFYALFPAGPNQTIANTTNCTPSLKIHFDCNLDAKWFTPITNGSATAPQPTDIDFDPDVPCLTIMRFDYAGACLNGKEPPKGIGGGAIFLIILFSVLLIYFIVGLGYNGCVKKESGIKVIPNAQFWIGLPLNAIEGCRATLGMCSGTPKASRATYESV